MSIAAVVLAAGAGRRFTASGGVDPKLLTPLDGVPLIVRVVDTVLAASVGPLIVVSGAVDLEGALADRPVELVRNERWPDGIATSLHAGIAVAGRAGHDAVVVGLGDQPGIPPGAWQALATHRPPPPIAVATYGGRRRNPVHLAAEVWDLLPAGGDEGARDLMRRRPDLVAEIACAGEPDDVDTVEDLDRWS